MIKKYQIYPLFVFYEGNPATTDGFPNKGTVMRKVFLFRDVIMKGEVD